jgi:hypothetical protein
MKRSFAEVATFRQRLFIWLSDRICGSSGLLDHYRALTRSATIPGDRPVRPDFEKPYVLALVAGLEAIPAPDQIDIKRRL